MRTKTLLATAALSAAGVVASQAQVFSVNAVGYINLDVPAGFSMIANQLNNNGNNTLPALIPAPPGGTTVFKFVGSGFQQATYDELFGEWSGDAITLVPGEGAFIRTPTAFKVTFVGEVSTGNLQNSIPAGFSIRSSQVPQAGKLVADLKYTPAGGDTIFLFNTTSGQYDQATWDDLFGEWTGAIGEPTIKVGEAFWVKKVAAGSWDRTFNVNTP
jgi:hypothetical protein